jgi:small subunit ribosomal protein S21
VTHLTVSYQKHYHAEEHSGICVVRRKGESVEDLIKRFRKKFSKSGIAKEFRDRMFFEKPSDKKRRKLQQSIRAIKRDEEKMRLLQEKYDRQKMKGSLKNKKKGYSKNYDSSNRRQDRYETYEKD